MIRASGSLLTAEEMLLYLKEMDENFHSMVQSLTSTSNCHLDDRSIRVTKLLVLKEMLMSLEETSHLKTDLYTPLTCAMSKV